MFDISIEKQKELEEFIARFDKVYAKAEEIGIDPQLIHELVLETYKVELIIKLERKKVQQSLQEDPRTKERIL